jgi:hypothetical protein
MTYQTGMVAKPKYNISLEKTFPFFWVNEGACSFKGAQAWDFQWRFFASKEHIWSPDSWSKMISNINSNLPRYFFK